MKLTPFKASKLHSSGNAFASSLAPSATPSAIRVRACASATASRHAASDAGTIPLNPNCSNRSSLRTARALESPTSASALATTTRCSFASSIVTRFLRLSILSARKNSLDFSRSTSNKNSSDSLPASRTNASAKIFPFGVSVAQYAASPPSRSARTSFVTAPWSSRQF